MTVLSKFCIIDIEDKHIISKGGFFINFKPVPIGVENFKRIIDGEYYYVDKTLMIKDILDNKSMVNLYTRPRRFGKTLNMSMIQYYFEKTDKDNSYLFENLNISKAGEKYNKHMGQYPVISISLKSMKQPNYEYAFEEFKNLITKEVDRHHNIIDSDKLSPMLYEKINRFYYGKAKDKEYISAIRLISDCLYSVYEKNVIILIDEYDVPLECAYFNGFYDEMVNLIRSAFESALKTNDSLEFGILTGCLRVSRESIFTGLNNPKINSITTLDYSEYFGFTEPEVRKIVEDYNISERFDDIKDWYDGYLFGKTEIYNPWSILNFISDSRKDSNILLKAYCSNTSSNDIIRELIFNGELETKSLIQDLMNGKSIEKPMYEEITYRSINVNDEYIWSFLLFTGYLKQIDSFLKDNIIYSKMVVPNQEVKSIYQNTISQWFKEKIRNTGTSELFNAVIAGNAEMFAKEVNKWLRKCISYQDNYESFYHGFLAGLLLGSEEYTIKSNRENGNGRTDIVICEYQGRTVAVIIEIKIADKYIDLEKKCDEALNQIESRNYESELIELGYQNIIKYGIAFCSEKVCRVKKK